MMASMSSPEAETELLAGLPEIPPHDEPGEPAGVASSVAAAASPWAIRDFRVIAIGQSLSSIGDAVTFTAMPLLVLALTGSGAAMGIVAALQTIPDLLLGLPAGALADRWDRRRMMLGADAGRAALTALIPLSIALHLPTMAVILIVVGPINALRVVFMAAWTGAIPSLVGRGLIGPATSYLEAIFSIGFIVGPGIAGVLAGVIGPGPTLAVDAASFVASAIALAVMRTPLQASTERDQRHLLVEIRDGLAFVRDHRLLRAAVAFWASVSIASAGLIPALTFFVTIDRRLGTDVFGLVISAYSLGTLAGALLATRLTRGRLGPLLLGGNAITGALLLVISLVGNPVGMAVLSLFAGVANMLVLVSYVTIRAASTPDHLLGRVGATTRMISIGLQPIGAATIGILLDVIGGTATLRLMAVAVIAISAAFVVSRPLREAHGTGRRPTGAGERDAHAA